MTDIIRTTAITSAMFLTAISPIGAQAETFNRLNTPVTSTTRTTAVTHLYDTNDGSVGRLTIGGYTAELYQGSSQYIVDAADSAAYIPWGNIVMIADHAYQGFSILRSLGAGATGTITDNSTITYLTCASSYQGVNTGNGINLADGRYAETVGDGSFMLYTCNDSTGVSVTVTYWYVSGTAAAPVYTAPEPVYEAPVQAVSYEAAPAEEIQSVVDTTVTEQEQPAADETTAEAQNSTEPVKADKVSITAVSDFADATAAPNNLSEVESGNKFFDLLTANKQAASDVLSTEAGYTAYYADNRRWLALSADQSTTSLVA